MKGIGLVVVAAGVAVLSLFAAIPASACAGDCDENARVTIDELLRGVRIALGMPGDCTGLDVDDDGSIGIEELVNAVDASLAGCPATASPTPTPTREINLPPGFPTPSLYQAFPGHEIAYPLGVSDPNGDPIVCAAEGLPDGAVLEQEVLTWTPGEDQVGAFEIPVTCSDDAEPPESAEGMLNILVSPLDDCTIPVCDPATGCEVMLPPPDQPCCPLSSDDAPEAPTVDCPLGAAVSMGRDVPGFTPLENCDLYRVTNQAQSGATVAFKLAARCVNTLNPVSVQIRMETGPTCSPPPPTPSPVNCRRPMVNFLQQRVFLTSREDGSTDPVRLTPAEVMGGTPFFDLQDSEANLVVTLRDSDGLEVTKKLRVILTFTPIPTLPIPSPTPTQTVVSE